jgi:hypothetical protein
VLAAISLIVSVSLSALLAEATSEEIYLQAAFDTAEFIHAHLYMDFMIQNSISARQNDSCRVDAYIDPGFSGLVIEGLSILASISNKASTQQLMRVLALFLLPYRLNHK